jgi:hypothetical protein
MNNWAAALHRCSGITTDHHYLDPRRQHTNIFLVQTEKERTNIITTQKADLDSVERNSNWLGLFAPYHSQHQTSKTQTLHINNTSIPQ